MASKGSPIFADEWLKSCADDALCRITESFGLGLEATKNLSETACILSIPESYTISSRSIANLRTEDPEFDAWMSHAIAPPSFQFQAAFLYHWLVADTNITKHLNNLPRYPELRLMPTFSDEELSFFRGLSVQTPASRLKGLLNHLHESFVGAPAVLSILRSHNLQTITTEQWVSTYQWATSRYMADPRDPDEVCFIPILDYANHRSGNPNARYEYFDGSFHLIHEQGLHKDVKAGEELFIDYGIGSRPDLCLMSYGFTPDTPCNPLVLRYNPQESDIYQAIDPRHLLPGLSSEERKRLETEYPDLVRNHGKVQSSFVATFGEDGSVSWKDDFLMLIACSLDLDYKYDDDGNLTIAFQGEPIAEAEISEKLSQNGICMERAAYVLLGLAKWALGRLAEIIQDLADAGPEFQAEYKEEAALAKLEQDCWEKIYNHTKTQCFKSK